MGNCAPKPKPPSRSPIRLHGSESCPIAARIRVSLLYKSVPVEFVPVPDAVNRPFLEFGSDTVAGPADVLLRYIDSKFAGAPAAAAEWGNECPPAAAAIRLQHRSMKRHVAGMERWARDLVAGKRGIGGKGKGIGDWYGRLFELMLEHAQMEETFLFPLLERTADSDVCRDATEEHGRDLPMMNGIKEDIKMVMVMEAGTPSYNEALLNLSLRLKKFQVHCKEHFEEEEKKLLPLLDAAERTRREGGEQPWSHFEWAEELMKITEATHSQLFPLLMAGLHPDEALQYIDIVCRCVPEENQVSQDASIIGQLVRGHNATVMDQKLAFPQVMLIATVRQRFQMISIFYFSRETQGNLLFMYKSF